MNSTPKTHHNSKKTFGQMISFFFSSSITFICLFVSSKYHEETEKLHKLNDIFKNKNAKVAIGQKEGEKIAKKINKHMDASDSSDEEEIRYRPPAVEMSNQNLNYSLHEPVQPVVEEKKYTLQEVQQMMNLNKPTAAYNPLGVYQLPPITHPI